VPKAPGREFFAGDARDVAPRLLGMLLLRSDGRRARLVEVEAYMGSEDPGSHAYRGFTKRAATMFGPPGRLYVYFTYGMHWCANVVCGADGVPSAVLLRAAEPVDGLLKMREARWHGQRRQHERELCRGPARLCEAFGITGADDGADLVLADKGLWIGDDGLRPAAPVVATTRIGLTKGAELPWRYLRAGDPWVSRPYRPQATHAS
jgi:DNA-3-methyladenine glycosylase